MNKSSSGNKRGDRALRRAINRAESLLPGRPAPGGEPDTRWLAIIRVGDFISSHPVEVCEFAIRWMKRARGFDLPAALYCCLIEHLLEHHFDIVFPMFREAALRNKRVADYFYPYTGMFQFVQAERPKNVTRLKQLATELEQLYAAKGQKKETRREARRRRGSLQQGKPAINDKQIDQIEARRRRECHH